MMRNLLAGVARGRRGHDGTWPADSWVSDLVPHLAYGLAVAYEALRR